MSSFLNQFKRMIIMAVLGLMMCTVFFAMVDLAWLLIKDLITSPILLLDIDELLDIFGLFMLILIGLELMDTIHLYLTEHVIHVEVVMMVALIALVRKIIILDVKTLSFHTLIGIAALVLSLSIGYYVFKSSNA